MKFFNKIKFLFSNNFDTFIKRYLAGEDEVYTLGGPLTDESAMRFSAFFACLRVLAESFASVPVKEYRKLANGDREVTSETPISEVLMNRVNPDLTPFSFFEAMTYQVCLGGNAIATVSRDSLGRVNGLFPVEYQNIRLEIDKKTNRIVYKTLNDQAISREKIFHVPGPSVNGYIGMSILEYATHTIGLARSYETFNQKFFDNGAAPSGVFEHPAMLKDVAYARLKEDLNKNYTGLLNSGTPMLLEHGLQYKPLTMRPIDAQLLQNRRFQVEDICRFCRVPPHMIQDLSRSTNNNIEHQSLEFIRFTMLPYFRRMEEAINSQLLTEREKIDGYYYEFDLNTLLRGDSASMASAFAIGRQWGWYSVNDIRRMLNLNSIENGDIYLQPTNLIEAGAKLPIQEDKKENDGEKEGQDDESEAFFDVNIRGKKHPLR